ncbi:putative nucleic acid-binding protein, contains PIN domain [Abditibacterium utsteinense]|uniref:Putative nucleic acid-binding protein, contains PIN domain n=1 Tax=Abditibacterium utsteinense TaxID=1960156 RepID=A0A2S8SNZ7_9BACT|nr:PIN domain-containing protein [Abditibacterium utsteinense]PQV62522.1 putative nucleic acid-binding protein, contains PIN domain [Abditibacterium utsteinense]
MTTRAVCSEIGNALSKLRYRAAAVALLESLKSDSTVEIVPLTEECYFKAFQLFQSRPDKEWGLIDCISFVVMTERGLSDALSADEHVRQMGFRPLLKEPP